MCQSYWKNLDDLLHDDTLIFNGYQPRPQTPEKGSFLFTHDKENCGTTLFVEVRKFKKLLGREVEFLPFTPGENPNCEFRCINETDLLPCAAKTCNGNVIRELMQIVKQYIRTPPAPLSEDEIDRIIEG
jgi:hypothetical protein